MEKYCANQSLVKSCRVYKALLVPISHTHHFLTLKLPTATTKVLLWTKQCIALFLRNKFVCTFQLIFKLYIQLFSVENYYIPITSLPWNYQLQPLKSIYNQNSALLYLCETNLSVFFSWFQLKVTEKVHTHHFLNLKLPTAAAKVHS